MSSICSSVSSRASGGVGAVLLPPGVARLVRADETVEQLRHAATPGALHQALATAPAPA